MECPQLLSNLGMFVIEVNMISNAAFWVLDTSCGAHICNNLQVLERSRRLSKDEMILRLGDGKAVAAEAVGSLCLVISDHIQIELKDYYYLPNVCGPLNTLARGGYSYFITFTDDHSRYGYVYLMRYKSEAFGRTPQLNGVAERRNRTLFDMVRSMMNFMELPPFFKGYALQMETKLLNIPPSNTVPQTPHEIWHGKPASYKFIGYLKETARYYFNDPSEQKIFISRNAVFLEKDFPADSRRDEILLEESSEESQHDNATSFEPSVPTDDVPVLRRSSRESPPPKRYGFMGLTSQLHNDPKTEVTAFKARLVAKGYTQ
ncbi:UNVERIFIED_CONTAM: hypothetical protein Slati_3860900 [Sesamum latifolium]|uniref:Uncharacterized protein n=1 Tax=Sesamum latifolium TaxID=2727402 RepID=A0AAW2TKX6_9LAMI